MELKDIASVTGKPGLYKIVKPGKNMLILEELQGGKRFPLHRIEKVSSLDNVAIFTLQGEMPLSDVLYRISRKNGLDVPGKSNDAEWMKLLVEIVPDYDPDSVYASHVKKIVRWYELLKDAGFDFDSLKPEERDTPDGEETDKQAEDA